MEGRDFALECIISLLWDLLVYGVSLWNRIQKYAKTLIITINKDNSFQNIDARIMAHELWFLQCAPNIWDLSAYKV